MEKKGNSRTRAARSEEAEAKESRETTNERRRGLRRDETGRDDDAFFWREGARVPGWFCNTCEARRIPAPCGGGLNLWAASKSLPCIGREGSLYIYLFIHTLDVVVLEVMFCRRRMVGETRVRGKLGSAFCCGKRCAREKLDTATTE